MKIVIEDHDKRKKRPCEGAVFDDVYYIDVRDVPTMEDARARPWGESFFKNGKNHRVINDIDGKPCVARDYPRMAWVVDASTPEDVARILSESNGEASSTVNYLDKDGAPIKIVVYIGHFT